ncbi:phosphotransferase family protein [Thermodesulfobacteriota bacterium]
MLEKLSRHESFKNFLEEIAALGFTVSSSPQANSFPYGVIGGRSNARWWLIPLHNRHVSSSALALFQPVLPSAKFIKNVASTIISLGMSSLWAREKIYISCPAVFNDLFKVKNCSYAFFTGTDSPHRKTAIQIMDNVGKLLGFAKVSANKPVKNLMCHEEEILNHLKTLDLKTAYIPSVLLNKEIKGTSVLVIDTLKTRTSKSPVALCEPHIAFILELTKLTKSRKLLTQSDFLKNINNQAEQFRPIILNNSQKLLYEALRILNQQSADLPIETSSCHGDFTPWNCFLVDQKLYVFDWEYGKTSCSLGYDCCNFHLALPQNNLMSPNITIKRITELLQKHHLAKNDKEARLLILSYLCDRILLYIERDERQSKKNIVTNWEGEKNMMKLLENILNIMSQ